MVGWRLWGKEGFNKSGRLDRPVVMLALALELSQYCTRIGSEMLCMSINQSDLGQINILLSLALAMSNGARIDSWPVGPPYDMYCTLPQA